MKVKPGGFTHMLDGEAHKQVKSGQCSKVSSMHLLHENISEQASVDPGTLLLVKYQIKGGL
jgi:hypothetical protein